MGKWSATAAIAAAMLCWNIGAARAVDQTLVEAAKREGSLTLYTTLVINQLVRPMADAFQAKYGVKVNPVRADPGEIIRRVIDEAKAGRSQGDVFDGTTPAATLKKEGLVLRYIPDSAQNLPKEFIDPEGYWAAIYVLVSTPSINTTLVKPSDEPKSWDDLLTPRWKGKMVWSSGPGSTGGGGFVALVMKEYGEQRGRDFLGKLAQQNVASIPAATRQVLDQVMAGEYEMALVSSVHQVLGSADQGAPVKWLPISPALVSLVTTSVAKNAPHPNAAKLYMDFLLSDEGQTIFRDNFYVPASRNVKARDARALPDGQTFRGHFVSPEEIDAQIPAWQKTFGEFFR